MWKKKKKNEKMCVESDRFVKNKRIMLHGASWLPGGSGALKIGNDNSQGGRVKNRTIQCTSTKLCGCRGEFVLYGGVVFVLV